MPEPLQLVALLRQFGLRPHKSLGQHFLADDDILARIAAAGDLTPAETVLEIGPGLGTLTRHLAERAGRVLAVELDAALVPLLRQVIASYPNVEIIQGDILAMPLGNLAFHKVMGNIPYNITSPILRHVLEAPVKPARIVLTVQWEVAQRITARPGQMSLLAVSVQVYGKPTIVERIGAGAFYPAPQVNSAIVQIEPYPAPLVAEAERPQFFAVARAGFAQRRKQLRNALRAGLPHSAEQITTALAQAGIESSRRAETLTIAEWARLAHELGNR
jgi:16S rRNA (adenine1518-N6/adenine1519-N6)-dimethyltransferase